MAAQLVSETFDYDGGRQVEVYVPDGQPSAIVYAGDGQLIAPWGRRLQKPGLPPTMVVGVHRSEARDEMVRIREYSPGFDPAQFAAHESFVLEDVRPWVESRFGIALAADRTAVCGVSASAEFALAMGLRHPDVFGTVLAASPGGGYRPPVVLPDLLPRVYLVAGTGEPFFLENAVRWADALRAAGADIVVQERTGDHGDPFWAEEFPLMVDWAFG